MNTIENQIVKLLNGHPMNEDVKSDTLYRSLKFIHIIQSGKEMSFSHITLIRILGRDYQYILGVLMDLEDPILYQTYENYSNLLNFKLNRKYSKTITSVA